MGDFYIPKATVQQPSIERPVIIENADPHNSWKVKLSHSPDKKLMIIGLHWGEKEEATHVYPIDRRKFWAAMDQLRGVKQKRVK